MVAECSYRLSTPGKRRRPAPDGITIGKGGNIGQRIGEQINHNPGGAPLGGGAENRQSQEIALCHPPDMQGFAEIGGAFRDAPYPLPDQAHRASPKVVFMAKRIALVSASSAFSCRTLFTTLAGSDRLAAKLANAPARGAGNACCRKPAQPV